MRPTPRAEHSSTFRFCCIEVHCGVRLANPCMPAADMALQAAILLLPLLVLAASAAVVLAVTLARCTYHASIWCALQLVSASCSLNCTVLACMCVCLHFSAWSCLQALARTTMAAARYVVGACRRCCGHTQGAYLSSRSAWVSTMRLHFCR